MKCGVALISLAELRHGSPMSWKSKYSTSKTMDLKEEKDSQMKNYGFEGGYKYIAQALMLAPRSTLGGTLCTPNEQAARRSQLY